MPAKTKSLAFPVQPSLPFCMHQTWIGVESKTASLRDAVSRTPLAHVVSNISSFSDLCPLCQTLSVLTLGTHLPTWGENLNLHIRTM